MGCELVKSDWDGGSESFVGSHTGEDSFEGQISFGAVGSKLLESILFVGTTGLTTELSMVIDS